MNTERALKVIFMGTPAVAVPVLTALLDAGHHIAGVYAQPDRPSGRGKRVVPSGVKKAASERDLRVFQPASLRRDERARREMASLSPDLIVVAAYGLLLPSDTLRLPRLGCLNLHPSLLPRYRGPSPVAFAILNGEAVTGVTVMQIGEEMDSGPIVAQRETPVGPNETTDELTARLFQMGADLLLEVLAAWTRGEIQAQPQDDSRATTSPRLTKGDGEVDWHRSADYIAREVRAYHPWPGSFTYWRGRRLKIIEASAIQSPAKSSAPRGHVASVPEGVGVVTGRGLLVLGKIQLEGRSAVSAQDFVLGHRDFVGSTVGA